MSDTEHLWYCDDTDYPYLNDTPDGVSTLAQPIPNYLWTLENSPDGYPILGWLKYNALDVEYTFCIEYDVDEIEFCIEIDDVNFTMPIDDVFEFVITI